MSRASATDAYRFADPAQLCIGLHVHLDLSWTEHPFPFSSFKIKTLEQIATIQALGLPRVRYSPGRSDCPPLAAPPQAEAEAGAAATEAAAATDGAEAAPAAVIDAEALAAKRARLERLSAHRDRLESCEKDLLSKARIVKSITQNLFAQPAQVAEDAAQLVDAIARSLLVDADIAIHLMADKVGKEEVYVHGLNVCLLAMMLAKELKLPEEMLRPLGLGALFHDIGKIDMPDRIVRKLEPYTRAELNVVQQHCAHGVELAKMLNLPGEALLVLAQHHEHADGSGYPKQLKGEQISPLARIVAIVNRFDNLCNPNDPAKAMTPHEALSTMFGQQRAQFESGPLMTFVRCMGIYPPGTIVVLSNGAIGMVTSVNGSRPLKPSVLIHDPSVRKEEAIVVDLEQEPDVTIAKTVRPQQLPPEIHSYLSPRRRISYGFDAQARG